MLVTEPQQAMLDSLEEQDGRAYSVTDKQGKWTKSLVTALCLCLLDLVTIETHPYNAFKVNLIKKETD